MHKVFHFMYYIFKYIYIYIYYDMGLYQDQVNEKYYNWKYYDASVQMEYDYNI